MASESNSFFLEACGNWFICRESSLLLAIPDVVAPLSQIHIMASPRHWRRMITLVERGTTFPICTVSP